MCLALALAALTLTWGCTEPAPSLDTPSLKTIAEGYVRVALQLAQHNPGLVESWRGSDAWRPGPREPVRPLLARVRALQDTLAPLVGTAAGVDRYRAAYLEAQLKALGVAAERLAGTTMTFDAEARDALGIDPPFPADAAVLAVARKQLATLLPGQGSLASRYSRFRARLSIPAAKVEPVLRAALAACRGISAQALPLPADEQVELAMGSDSPWDGFARYLGGHRTRIEVNRAGGLDVTRAFRLACHEGYPGHHVQFILMDDGLVTGRGWVEFALTPAFGLHMLVTEGAAEAGVDLAFAPAERAALYRSVLLPAAGLPSAEAEQLVEVEELIARLEPAIVDISRAYLDNAITQAIAIERLRDEALTQEPESWLAFAERRRAGLLAYPAGRARVRRILGGDGLASIARVFLTAPFSVP